MKILLHTRASLLLAMMLVTPLGVVAADVVNTSNYVVMPDGVELAMDVWLPDIGSEPRTVPAIVEFTRYWRATEMQPASDNLNEARTQTLSHGYAFVAVDVRGTGASFGVREAEFSLAEVRDMPAVVDWIAAQPWSNGKVVSMGISYDGNTAELAGLKRSTSLVAAIPRFTDYDWYTSIVIPGGLKNAYITERWGDGVQMLDRNDVSVFGEHEGETSAGNPKLIGVKPVDADPGRVLLAEATAGHFANKSLADNLGTLTYRDEYPSAHDIDDDGGLGVSIHNFREDFEASNVPMYHWGSWFDAGTAAGILARFQSFDAPYRYVIGAWSHGANFDANPYKANDAPVDPSLDEQFDQIFEFANTYMDPDASPPTKELAYFTVGENVWKKTAVWPPRGHSLQRRWLASNATLHTSRPTDEDGVDQYAVNFDAGSGDSSRWATQLGGGDVIYPDRSEADQLLLTYTSEPLSAALELTGTAIVSLQLSSTHGDGALIVYLEDVDENGYVRMLTEGELRLVHAASDAPYDAVFGPQRTFKRADGRKLVPGQVTQVELALLPLSARIDKGHSIRIAIAGHDRDTFIRVPEYGDPVLSVHRNTTHASYIDLPVITNEPAPGPLNAITVQKWADQLFADAMSRKRMSGAVLTLVQDGEIVLSKGYGYADFAAGTAVDPDDTRFRIGSTTKTFTAMAIAQLLDDGRIGSLDDPANKYLQRLQLPSPDGVDITLKQLLTHSAGFENRVYNIGTDRDFELPLSPQEIARFEPSLVSAPGQYSAYNNYGTTVLGLIVEDVSGEPIADYLDAHIFKPLGMSKSILNMSARPSEGLSTPYAFFPSGEAQPIPHRTVHPFYAPVGGINATGNDMARYMIAQLAAGTNEGAILSPELFSKMHTQLRSNHELSSGFGMIYFTWVWNGTQILVHGGDWPGTHSGMILLPETGTGLFFSLLAEYPEVPILEGILGSERLIPNPEVTVDTPITNLGVLSNFFETFFGTHQQPVSVALADVDLSEYHGNYVGQSAPISTMERLLNLTNPFNVVTVYSDESGESLYFNDKGPFVPIAPDVFWTAGHKAPLDGLFLDSPIYSFARDDNGQIDYLVPQIGFDAWVKSGALKNPQTYGSAWALLFLICMTGIVAVFYPRLPGRPWAKWLPGIVIILLLAMPLVLMLGRPEAQTVVDDLFFGHGGRFTLFAVIANLLALLGIVYAWHVRLAWQELFWSGSKLGGILRVHYSVLGLATVLFIPVFLYLNLIGF